MKEKPARLPKARRASLTINDLAQMPKQVRKLELEIEHFKSYTRNLGTINTLIEESKSIQKKIVSGQVAYQESLRLQVGAQVEELVKQFRLNILDEKIWKQIESVNKSIKEIETRLVALEERTKRNEETASRFDEYRKFKLFWEEERESS